MLYKDKKLEIVDEFVRMQVNYFCTAGKFGTYDERLGQILIKPDPFPRKFPLCSFIFVYFNLAYTI